MKKLRMLMLCFTFLFLAASCGKKEDTKWIDESAAMISTEITDGQFVLDGVVYTFPMDLQYWLDNGWHISNNYGNKNTFKLDPWYNSEEFELFNEEGDWVRVAAYNNSDEAAKLDQCMVYSVYMSLEEVDIVLPAGMTKRNKSAEVLAAYGEPDAEGDEEGKVEAFYMFSQDDDWQCKVKLDICDDNKNPMTSVSYQMMLFTDFWDAWVKSDGIEKAVEYYVNADIKASFFGDYEDCVNYSIASQEEAEEWYAMEKAYYAETLMWYAEVNSDYMDEATLERFYELAGKILAKATWEFKNVTEGSFGGGTATIVVHPTNFLDIILDDISQVSEEWNTKYATANFDTMTDEEYAVLECDYADMLLKALDARVAETKAGEPVELVCDLDIDGTILTEDSWMNIYDALMGFYFEEE